MNSLAFGTSTGFESNQIGQIQHVESRSCDIFTPQKMYHDLVFHPMIHRPLVS